MNSIFLFLAITSFNQDCEKAEQWTVTNRLDDHFYELRLGDQTAILKTLKAEFYRAGLIHGIRIKQTGTSGAYVLLKECGLEPISPQMENDWSYSPSKEADKRRIPAWIEEMNAERDGLVSRTEWYQKLFPSDWPGKVVTNKQ